MIPGIYGWPGEGTGIAATLVPRLSTNTSSGSFVIPDGVVRIFVQVWGGGGGAGLSGTYCCGGGGGYSQKVIDVVPSQIAAVTVGAAGAGNGAGTGTTGGTSSVVVNGVTVQATGGSGGNPAAGSATGGVGSGGDINLRGSSGVGTVDPSLVALLGPGTAPYTVGGAYLEAGSGYTAQGMGGIGASNAGQAGLVLIWY